MTDTARVNHVAPQSGEACTADLSVDEARGRSETREPLLALVEGLIARDESALEQLSRVTSARLYAIAMRVLRCSEDAEEIVADVLLWLWDHPHRFDASRGELLAWLGNLTWRRAVDACRARQRRENIVHPDVDPLAYENRGVAPQEPSDWQMQFESSHQLTQVLGQLKQRQRDMIVLAFVDGLTQQEISQRHGLPLGTVKSEIRRGLQAMRKALGLCQALAIEG